MANMFDRRDDDDIRPAHQCHRDGCDSQARWQAGLEIQCVGIGRHRQSLQCPSSIMVCDRHTKYVPAYLLSERNKANIAQGLTKAGFPLPDFSSAVIVFMPVDHDGKATPGNPHPQ